jgi:hypothetical protein
MKNSSKLILITLILGFFFRIIGLNWDQGQHLHPDERFLSMVLNDIQIPNSFAQYFDPKISTLNPYNQGYSFYVYGSFPVNLVKSISVLLNLDSYNQAYLVGRVITIILDTSIILLIFLICKKIFDYNIALISSFLYATCVLPIQLSHFFIVDPFLNFFLFLCFYFLVSLSKTKHPLRIIIFLSISFGFALASKISAIYFSPIILLSFIFNFKNNFKLFLKYGLIFLVTTILIFRISQPQIFINGNYLNWEINPQFISNLSELKIWDKNPAYPPAIQWIKVIPIYFPIKNLLLWGLGLPSGILFITSMFFIFLNLKKFKNKKPLILILFWIIFLILLQGSQAVSTMRYFLPIYPFICIASAIFLNFLFRVSLFKKYLILKYLIFVSLVFYPIMFLSIFFKNHTRVNASLWIYQNIPVNSVIATEYWDDALPLSIGKLNSSYQFQTIHIADVEENDSLKISKIKEQLNQSDYYLLSSNRFYKPIPENSDVFPETTKFYQSLFDGSLGFKQIAKFSSYPCFPPIGKSWFCLSDDLAEEAFTVFDHPKVIIFQKVSHISL